MAVVEHRGKINKKNQLKDPENLCEGAIASKHHWNDTFVIPFKNYGWWPEPLSNMAATVIKKRKFDKKFQLKNSEKSLEGPIAFRLQENDTFVINFPKYGW